MWQGGRVERARAGGRPLEQRRISGVVPTAGQAGGGMPQPTKDPDAMLLLMEHTARTRLGQVTRNARQLN
jgi:hypothetical protein